MKKMIDIPFGSSRYDDLVELRYKILLEPLGLKFLDMHRNKEAGYLHIGCIESKVSMRIVDHDLESVVAALKAVFREYLVLTCDIVVRHEEILNLFTIDECRYVSNVCIIAVSSLNYCSLNNDRVTLEVECKLVSECLLENHFVNRFQALE